MPASISYFLSLIVYTLGALTFCVLTAFYWSGQRRAHTAGNSAIFRGFTLVCAVAFVSNLLYQEGVIQGAWIVLLRNLAAGLTPAFMLHLVLEIESGRLGHRGMWLWILGMYYGAGTATSLIRGLNEAGWLVAVGSEALFHAPSALLAATATTGIILQATTESRSPVKERGHRRWMYVVLALMVIAAFSSLAGLDVARQVADYLLLAFMGLCLYRLERLIFIDLLVKGGAFLLAGVVVVVPTLVAGSLHQGRLPVNPLYVLTLFSLALWLMGPWACARVARLVDRIWLRRPFSAAEAERHFLHEIQSAATEAELKDRAALSLGMIFQTAARLDFGSATVPEPDPSDRDSDTVAAKLRANGVVLGRVHLAGRPNGIPFLSDDRRLLQTLSGSLGLALENVRFRESLRAQAEREQQLRLLASRAELRALRAQINPHFLFNTLSVIAGLVHDQPALADETIEHLAHVFRYALKKSENEWALVSEEVEFVAAYLRIEQARFGDRLRVELELEEAAARQRMPAMTLQPLVENAIRHGVFARERMGTVTVRSRLRDGTLRVEVLDSGPGFAEDFALDADSEGHGLRNVAERIEGYYGAAAMLTWLREDGRTCVALCLPVEHSAPAALEEGRNAHTYRGR